MDPERFEVVKRLLIALEDVPAGERTAYLDRACAGDASLRQEVDSLLMDGKVPTLLRTKGMTEQVAAILQEGDAAVGRQIGPYRLVEVLGQGGMGVVYRALQSSPIQREVALKLVRPGMDSARVVARFESERQAVALMEHPGIAHVYDAGAAEDGRPYFAMELVRGEAITDWAARERPPLAERLRLFLQVCDAVQHAHQRGIIHRDLKPSNVLLTRQDAQLVPKVIDFGIAKAIEPGVMASPGTLGETILGTPEYMSPEQAGLLELGVDTRTDVYSLGVMLYELVSGQRPYQLERRTLAELDRLQRTRPRPPSQVEPSVGLRTRRGRRSDIDAVALMAMERSPDDRYASVERLADDVRRVLEHRPVRARTQTWTYRTSRFVRRHALGVGTAAVVLLLVAASGIAVVRERNRAVASEARAVREAANARTEAAKASEVARFLTDLFRESDPDRARGASVTARELLERGAQRISSELGSQDEVRASLMDTIGTVYRLVGQVDKAEALTTEALAVRRRVLGSEHPDVAQSLDNLGQLARERTTYDVAERYHREALAQRRKLLDPKHPDLAQSLGNLSLALRERGQLDEAETLAREALAIRLAALGPDHPDVWTTSNLLADITFSRGRPQEAERLHRDVLAARRRILPADHPAIAVSINNVALVLGQSGRYDEAEPLFREALALRRRTLDADHPELTSSINNLASLLHDLGRWDEAEPLYREALALDRRRSGNRHMDVAVDLNNLASLVEDRGRPSEAEPLYEESLRIRLALQGEQHPSVATVFNNLGRLRFTRGDLAGAEQALRRALAIREALGLGAHPRQATTLAWLGRVFQARGNRPEAERLLRSALAIEREASPDGSAGRAAILVSLGALLVRNRDPGAAEPLLTEALAWRRKNQPRADRLTGEAEAALAECLIRLSRAAEAEPLLLSALETAPDKRGAMLYSRRAVLELLVAANDQLGRAAEAAAFRARLTE
jgi:tetratricopeptide (TPR) repeat protein